MRDAAQNKTSNAGTHTHKHTGPVHVHQTTGSFDMKEKQLCLHCVRTIAVNKRQMSGAFVPQPPNFCIDFANTVGGKKKINELATSTIWGSLTHPPAPPAPPPLAQAHRTPAIPANRGSFVQQGGGEKREQKWEKSEFVPSSPLVDPAGQGLGPTGNSPRRDACKLSSCFAVEMVISSVLFLLLGVLCFKSLRQGLIETSVIFNSLHTSRPPSSALLFKRANVLERNAG